MTLSYCSLSCCSSASLVSSRCWMIEKPPRMPHAAATVSEMARIRRAPMDRILNMGLFRTPRGNDPESHRGSLSLNNDSSSFTECYLGAKFSPECSTGGARHDGSD